MKRVRLDVRWDPETAERARAAGGALGVKPSALLRRAAALGLDAAVEEARSTLVNGGDVVRVARTGEVMRVAAVASSGGDGIVPAAGSASSRASAGAPVSPSGGAGQPALVRLEAVVARRLAPRTAAVGALAPAPADLARARREVLGGRVLVGGQQCRNPAQLVAPVDVSL